MDKETLIKLSQVSEKLMEAVEYFGDKAGYLQALESAILPEEIQEIEALEGGLIEAALSAGISKAFGWPNPDQTDLEQKEAETIVRMSEIFAAVAERVVPEEELVAKLTEVASDEISEQYEQAQAPKMATLIKKAASLGK